MSQIITRREVVSQVYEQLGNSEEVEYLLDWLKDAWDTVDELVKRFGEEQTRKMLEAEPEEKKKPFQRIRELHSITIEELLGDIDRAISSEAIKHFDRTGEGTSFVIDACLDSLSALAGEEYTRENVGGIIELPYLRRDTEPKQTGP